jgi:hypothetical protein
VKLYVASSWKNEHMCRILAGVLRDYGHEVDCFCDPASGRFVFRWPELVSNLSNPADLQKYNAQSFLADERTQRAFAEDKKWLDWCDGVVLVLPSGRSAHLEAGYAVGRGKPVWAWGKIPDGEFDVMYGFFAGLYNGNELSKCLRDIAAESVLFPRLAGCYVCGKQAPLVDRLKLLFCLEHGAQVKEAFRGAAQGDSRSES